MIIRNVEIVDVLPWCRPLIFAKMEGNEHNIEQLGRGQVIEDCGAMLDYKLKHVTICLQYDLDYDYYDWSDADLECETIRMAKITEGMTLEEKKEYLHDEGFRGDEVGAMIEDMKFVKVNKI